MQNLLQELGLSIFSVCLQTSIGMMMFLFIFERFNALKSKILVFTALCIAVVGVLSSFLHLGNPTNAYLTINNISSSWLSREIFIVSVYTAALFLYFILRFIKGCFNPAFDILGFGVAIIGLITLYVMSEAYISTSVPFWDSVNTYFEYYLSAVMLGAMFFYAIMYGQLSVTKFYNFSVIILLSVGLLAVSYVFHGLGLSQGSIAARQSEAVLFSYSWLMGIIWALGGISMCLFFFNGIKFQKENTAALSPVNLFVVSAALLFLAAILAKLIFYVAMVTTSVGLQ